MTRNHTKRIVALAVSAALPLGFVAGCESLPGNEEQQGAAIGGAGGAAAGAALYEDNRALGALVGGLLGAGGGYVVGTQLDKNESDAEEAAQRSQQNPVTVDDVQASNSADIDGNGFVTMDELIAMREAGLSGDEIIQRAEATEQVFELNRAQTRELAEAGYADATLDRLEEVNRNLRQRYEDDRSSGRVSEPRYN
jgi:hypothetical protein